MSEFVRAAAQAQLQSIVNELLGMGYSVSVDNGQAEVLAPTTTLEVMKRLPPPAAAGVETETEKPRRAKRKAKPAPVSDQKPGCKVIGCDRISLTKGFCGKHAQQYYKGKIDADGKPIEGKE